MEPTIDHISVPSPEPETAALWLATILGIDRVEPDGPGGDMFKVVLGVGNVLFVESDEIAHHHVAFRVDAGSFDAVVARLREGGVAFGNDPEDAGNGQTADFLGGRGRVYFSNGDGHLFEVCTA
jgi:catechol 2,3-dioxygenase-like lactoylglutathione lyase family enzyme